LTHHGRVSSSTTRQLSLAWADHRRPTALSGWAGHRRPDCSPPTDRTAGLAWPVTVGDGSSGPTGSYGRPLASYGWLIWMGLTGLPVTVSPPVPLVKVTTSLTLMIPAQLPDVLVTLRLSPAVVNCSRCELLV
jgi:hypothetical protein